MQGQVGTAVGGSLLVLAIPAAYIAEQLDAPWVSVLIVATSLSAGTWLAIRARNRLDRHSS